MKQTLRLALTALALAGLAATASPAKLSLEEGSWLRLEGDSSLHAYVSTATRIELEAELEPAAASLRESVESGALRSFELEIPVAGLRSGKDGLDKNMRASLKADEHEEIEFKMEQASLAGSTIALTGTLSVAGSRRPAVIEGVARFEGNTVRVSGRHELKMSDFGIKPPTMMFGAIKTEDRVVVAYGLRLRIEEKKP